MIACCFIEQSLREAEVTRSEFVKQQEYAQQQQLQFVSEAVSMEVTLGKKPCHCSFAP